MQKRRLLGEGIKLILKYSNSEELFQIAEELKPNATENYVKAVSRFWYSNLQNIRSVCQHLLQGGLLAVEDEWSKCDVETVG